MNKEQILKAIAEEWWEYTKWEHVYRHKSYNFSGFMDHLIEKYGDNTD